MSTQLLTRRTATAEVHGHYLPRTRTVTGTPAELAAIVTTYQRAGTLHAISTPRPVTADRYRMLLRVCEYQPIQPATVGGSTTTTTAQRTRPVRRIAVIATAAASAVAGIVAVAAYLIGQLVAFVSAHTGLIAAVLVVLGLLAVALVRTGAACAGLHCPGCPHH